MAEDVFDSEIDSEIDSYMSKIWQVRNHISHLCDGPITPFVLIRRACQLVEDKKYDATTVANALDDELTDRSWLLRDIIEITGS